MHYMLIAPRVKNGAGWLGIQFMLEAAKRLPKAANGFVRIECEGLLLQADHDADYCLDAPDELPAGGCCGYDLGDAKVGHFPEIVPSQITIRRY